MRVEKACLFLTILSFLCAGCEDDREKVISERRDKALKCHGEFVKNFNAYASFWNNYVRANSGDERRVQLGRCRQALQRIDPYHPLGVDPLLGEAIREVKSAALARVDIAERNLDAWFPDTAQADAATQRLDAASQNLDACINSLAAELGGIQTVPGH